MTQQAINPLADKPKTPSNDLISFLNSDAMKRQITNALPKHLSPERMLRVITTEIRRTPKLVTCTKESFLSSILQASQLGLEPSGPLGHAYLIPYGRECKLIIGYRGMIDLARRSGQIVSINAYAVYSDDEFNYQLGLNPDIQHIPKSKNRSEKTLTHVYAVANLKDGGVQFRVLDREDIDRIRKASKTNNIWNDHFEEMAKKTAIRALFKYLPVSIEYLEAFIKDERSEYGIQDDFIETDYSQVIPEETPELEHQQAEQVDLATGEIRS